MSGRRVAPSPHRIAVPLSVGIVGLALIGVGQAVPNRHSIENDLTQRSSVALKNADLVGLTVSFSGRDATITGVAAPDLANRAEDVVSAVDGVRVANAELSDGGAGAPAVAAPAATDAPAPTPTETPAATASPAAEPTETAAPVADLPVGFTLDKGVITVTGTVRSQDTATELIKAATSAGKGWKVTDKLAVDPGLAAEPVAVKRFPAITTLLAKAPINGAKLVIQYDGAKVILRGAPANWPAEKALLKAAAHTVKSKSDVIDGLDVPKS